MIIFRVDPLRNEPIYEQVSNQVRDAVIAGRLRPGDRLPSHRDLAATLVINHLTVKRAYEGLERDGIIETRRGLGTFVCRTADRALVRERRRELEHALKELLEAAAATGLTAAELRAMIDASWPAHTEAP